MMSCLRATYLQLSQDCCLLLSFIIAIVDCDWLSDLIEGAPEVATVNPTAERLKQGAGKNIRRFNQPKQAACHLTTRTGQTCGYLSPGGK